MRSAFALRIFSGKYILNFGVLKSLRTFQNPFSQKRFGTNSLSLCFAKPAPSEREPLARPDTLHFSRKPYRHAKGPIPEGAVIERSEMTGGVPSPKRKHRSVRGRSGACVYDIFTIRKVFPRLMQSSSRSYSAGTSPMTFTFSSAGRSARTSWISPE